MPCPTSEQSCFFPMERCNWTRSFGRLLEGQADAMVRYRQSQIEITDPEVIKTSGKRFHPIVEASRQFC